jgi:predicted small metal-binding protein
MSDQSGGATTAKILRCGELIAGCEETIEGADLEEILGHAREHMQGAHGVGQISGYVEARLWAAIRAR